MKKHALLALAFAVYVTAIVASNWLIEHVGIPAGPGTHLTQVGFGLLAPSGVWAAAVSFPARDVTQRLGGRWLGVAAIVVGALVSLLTSSGLIAVASGVTYLCSEGADMVVYTRLQRGARALSVWWFVMAVYVSGLVAIVIDSLLFLHLGHYLVGLPDGRAAVEGMILGKFWVIAASAPIAWALRRKLSVRA